MSGNSVWRLEGRYAGSAMFAILAIPATFFAFVISVSAGKTFSGLDFTLTLHIHFALAALWMVMLATQAWLARSGNIPLHRMIGRTSYVLAPMVFASMILVFHEFLMRRPFPYDEQSLRFDVYNWLNPLGFIACWGLAIFHRKQTPLHMRYMIGTVFAIGSAIIFRILLNYFAWAPGFDNLDVLVVVTALILVAPLVWLIVRERDKGFAFNPFWVPLTTNVLIVIGYFTFSQSEWWSDLIYWFAALPIS